MLACVNNQKTKNPTLFITADKKWLLRDGQGQQKYSGKLRQQLPNIPHLITPPPLDSAVNTSQSDPWSSCSFHQVTTRPCCQRNSDSSDQATFSTFILFW